MATATQEVCSGTLPGGLAVTTGCVGSLRAYDGSYCECKPYSSLDVDQNNSCVCDNGYSDVNNECVAQAQPAIVLTQPCSVTMANSVEDPGTGECVCDAANNYVSDDSGNCIPDCPNIMANSVYLPRSESCTCSSGYYESNGECVYDCNSFMGANSVYVEGSGCVCADGYSSFLGTCQEDCASGYQRDFFGNCLDIDECLNSDPCPEFGDDYTCTNNDGGYECSCPDGYEFEVGTGQCNDINECDLGTHNCEVTTHLCSNGQGDFTCVDLHMTIVWIMPVLWENEFFYGNQDGYCWIGPDSTNHRQWRVISPMATQYSVADNYYSFENVAWGTILRHSGHVMYNHNPANYGLTLDATYRIVSGISGEPGTVSFQSVNFPDRYIWENTDGMARHYLYDAADDTETIRRAVFTLGFAQ